jgi:diacylglycerol kinase (ATP)
MASNRQRRAILIHNEKAGDKRHEREALVELLERAGYSVSYFPAKHCDLGEVLGHPAEIIVSAGGDGTVARVVREARSDGPPIAVLRSAPPTTSLARSGSAGRSRIS